MSFQLNDNYFVIHLFEKAISKDIYLDFKKGILCTSSGTKTNYTKLRAFAQQVFQALGNDEEGRYALEKKLNRILTRDYPGSKNIWSLAYLAGVICAEIRSYLTPEELLTKYSLIEKTANAEIEKETPKIIADYFASKSVNDVKSNSVSEKKILELIQKAGDHVKKIDLTDDVYSDENPFLAAVLARASIHCKNLEYLNLSQQTMDVVGAFIANNHFTQLKVLRCTNLDYFIKSVIDSIVTKNKQLETFAIEQYLSDVHLKPLITELPNLTSLKVCTSRDLTGASFEAIENLPHRNKMEFLDLTSCYEILTQNFPLIARGYLNLRNVKLRECNVDDGFFQILADPQRKNRIEELDISNCKQLTDQSLKFILTGLPDLTFLNISDSRQYTENAFTLIENNPPHTKLKSLIMSSCKNISATALQKLPKQYPNLAVLDLEYCQVSDDLLENIAKDCSKLKNLSLKRCQDYTNEGLDHLATVAGLESLQMGGYGPKVTFNRINELQKQLPNCDISTDITVYSFG